jgi:hypothetical protein
MKTPFTGTEKLGLRFVILEERHLCKTTLLLMKRMQFHHQDGEESFDGTTSKQLLFHRRPILQLPWYVASQILLSPETCKINATDDLPASPIKMLAGLQLSQMMCLATFRAASIETM